MSTPGINRLRVPQQQTDYLHDKPVAPSKQVKKGHSSVDTVESMSSSSTEQDTNSIFLEFVDSMRDVVTSGISFAFSLRKALMSFQRLKDYFLK